MRVPLAGTAAPDRVSSSRTGVSGLKVPATAVVFAPVSVGVIVAAHPPVWVSDAGVAAPVYSLELGTVVLLNRCWLATPWKASPGAPLYH